MSLIRNRERLIDHGNERERAALLDIAEAAIDATHPKTTVPDAVEREGDTLRVGDRTFDLESVEDVYVVAAGKGSVAVAEELLCVLGDRVTDCLVAEKAGQAREVSNAEVVGAGHPIPDETSLRAGRRAAAIASEADGDDLVFACITGGASAQLVVPADGLALSDVAETTDVLLRSGLPIDEINTVRKHLSEIKGGQLSRRIAPASTVTLVTVDEVAGVPWGPTVPDATTYDDALAVLARHGLEGELPAAVADHLRRGAEGERPETPTEADLESTDTHEVVLADPADACEAARDRAVSLGYDAAILSTSIEGESREVATALSAIADEVRTYGRPFEPPCVLVSGGETTVTVREDAGDGGPNQEFALRFVTRMADATDVTTLAIGTDGTDGPTDIAGGLVDAETARRLRRDGIDPHEHLRRNNAAEPLEAAGDAVYTGETGTNVMDLRLTLVTDRGSRSERARSLDRPRKQ